MHVQIHISATEYCTSQTVSTNYKSSVTLRRFATSYQETISETKLAAFFPVDRVLTTDQTLPMHQE